MVGLTWLKELEALRPLVPTADETAALRAYKQKKPTPQLSRAEDFLVGGLCIV